MSRTLLSKKIYFKWSNGNTNFYADAFFESVKPCPDGNYECTEYTNSVYYPTTTIYNTVPNYIGPNSKQYPYWNNYNFNTVYHLKSDPSNNIFNSFQIYTQPILTCNSNCDLHIGLYQPLYPNPCALSYVYSNENSCGIPTQSSYPLLTNP